MNYTEATTSWLMDACTHYSGAEVEIVAPGAGYIVISAQFGLNMEHDLGVEDEILTFIGTDPSDCTNDGYVNYQVIYDDISQGFYMITSSVQEVFSVSGAGTHTFYLNGYVSWGWVANTEWITDISMVVVFYPS